MRPLFIRTPVMLEVFVTLGSLYLVAKGVGWVANMPIRAINSLTAIEQPTVRASLSKGGNAYISG